MDVLTAKHGHEYSPPRRSPSPASNGFFAQMPLSSLLGSLNLQGKKTASSAPASPAPVAPAPIAKVESPAQVPSTPGLPKSLVKEEPEAPVTSPTPSRPASSSSVGTAEEKPKKRTPRPKTTYNLAQPPPSSHPKKLHIRPKVLLQLHQVVPGRRPKPVYEVIPFSILAPISSRRLARTFNCKDKLGAHDLLIVKAEEYGSSDGDKSDDEQFGARDVVGVICPGKEEKGAYVKTEVLMDDSSHWEVTKTPNGGYDFTCTDEHGLTLRSRWVPKPAVTRRQSNMSNVSSSPTLGPDDRKFTFSTISANSRRHPIIATMTRERIEVLDAYTIPTATSPPTPSALATPIETPSSIDMQSFMDNANDRQPVKTDDALRRFIVASGIWVAFCENWSPAYSASKNACPPLNTSAAIRPPQPSRTVSMSFIDSPRSASPASASDEKSRTLPRIIRTGTQLLHRNSSFNSTMSSPVTDKAPPGSPALKTRGRRSNSTGNAELPSKTGSMRKRFGLALEDQTLEETEEERQVRRSSELLRIRELSLPSPFAVSAPDQAQSQTLAPIPSHDPPASDRSVSPTSSNRANKKRSSYNPVTTAGLWDSGVVEKPGLKTRPTSMIVMKQKNKKKAKKEERSKSKEKKEKESRRKSESFKLLFTGMFSRKEKTVAA